MKYQKQEIEAYLREYTTLQVCVVYGYDEDLSVAKIDLDNAIRKLQKSSPNLYKTIMGVFVYGNPIQEQAKQMDVSKRQISRRLDDGVHMLTMIMNGEVL
jgi:hypothetical protein